MNLASNWWALALRGAAAIVFGLIALISPPSALAALVFLFGVYAVVDGVLNLISAARAHGGERWGSLALEGMVSLICGLLAIFWPGITALALVMLIGAWSVITGIAEIAAAVRLRKHIQHEWLLGLSGVLSIVFGILLFVAPVVGLVVLAVWIGAYAIVFGALLVGLGFRLRAFSRTLEQQSPAVPGHA
jgi:uncharacterized membrane protein HdeD (DUF308 family)